MDDAWRKSSRHRMSQETVTGRFLPPAWPEAVSDGRWIRELRPIPIRKITNWKRVSTALEKIDNPNLNSIPNDIASTDEIDFAIGALTNHFRTVVEKSEREVPASSDRWKFPPDILELIRVKNAA
ncbi:hypothetical protein EVAR_32336_1 [Eumeta japonica]|uniref:Uncharacterized protein n=1 Tax=Eumeta variegata TaxID=151549 RepID=A0A4C1ZAH6_EUMVA|nr:hypothetical protein EVAR_32336_1 [Eumeta japonica]